MTEGHFRIIGWLWLLWCGLVMLFGLASQTPEANYVMSAEAVSSQKRLATIELAVFAALALSSCGLLFGWRWARVAIGILAVVLLLASAVLMIWGKFAPAVSWPEAIAAEMFFCVWPLALSVYSLLTVLLVKDKSRVV